MDAAKRLEDLLAKYRYVLFFVVMASILLVMSHNSFLYPFNEFEDQNCFYSSAKYLLSGKVLYKDFFEQKGPAIYFLNAICLFLWPNSYHGIYLMEIVFACFYCKYIYAILHVINPNRKALNVTMTILSAGAMYGARISSGGGEIEEYALPLFAYALYHVVAYLMDKKPIRFLTCVFVGIHCGLLFWAKYLVLAFYVPLILFTLVVMIVRKDKRLITEMILGGTTGFVLVTGGMITYFVITQSLSDMVNVYFLANMLEYKPSVVDYISPIMQFWNNLVAYYEEDWLPSIIFMGYILFICGKQNELMKNKSRLLLFGFTMFVHFGVLIIISALGLGWGYYFIPMTVTYCLIMVIAYDLVSGDDFKSRWTRFLILILPVFSICLSLVFYSKIWDIYPKEYQIRTEISNLINEREYEDIRIFNEMDSGYYYLTDNLPENRYYFTRTNLRQDLITGIDNNAIETGEADCAILVLHEEQLEAKDDAMEFFEEHGYGYLYENVCPHNDTVILFGR